MKHKPGDTIILTSNYVDPETFERYLEQYQENLARGVELQFSGVNAFRVLKNVKRVLEERKAQAFNLEHPPVFDHQAKMKEKGLTEEEYAKEWLS